MKSFDWQSNGERVEGAWYWVTDGSEVWPAVSRKSSVGGWGNDDTWEDFQKEVTAWQLMPKPLAPMLIAGLPVVIDETIPPGMFKVVTKP